MLHAEQSRQYFFFHDTDFNGDFDLSVWSGGVFVLLFPSVPCPDNTNRPLPCNNFLLKHPSSLTDLLVISKEKGYLVSRSGALQRKWEVATTLKVNFIINVNNDESPVT